MAGPGCLYEIRGEDFFQHRKIQEKGSDHASNQLFCEDYIKESV